jgi:Flp pilus assembly pilin Flp
MSPIVDDCCRAFRTWEKLAVKQLLSRVWHETDGVLSFEWTMLTSLLTVGVVSGMASVRDAVTDEMGDLAQAMVSLDQSYNIQPPLVMRVHGGNGLVGSTGSFSGGFGGISAAAPSAFIDASSYEDCGRGNMKVIEFPRSGERQDLEAAPPAAEELAPAL